jgi:hypothetical protein
MSEPTPASRIAGTVSTWIRACGWINGDDHRRYFAHRENVMENLARRLPAPGDRVTFRPDPGDRSLVARDVRWEGEA